MVRYRGFKPQRAGLRRRLTLEWMVWRLCTAALRSSASASEQVQAGAAGLMGQLADAETPVRVRCGRTEAITGTLLRLGVCGGCNLKYPVRVRVSGRPCKTLQEACHCASLQQSVERRKLWLNEEWGITAEVRGIEQLRCAFFFKRCYVSRVPSVPFVRAELLYTVIRVRPSCQNIPIQRQDHAPWNHHPSSFLRLQYIYQHQSKKKHTSTTGRRAGLCGFIVYTGYTLRCTT